MTVFLAFIFNSRLLLNAMDFGVSLEVGRTRALSFVVDALAQGIETA